MAITGPITALDNKIVEISGAGGTASLNEKNATVEFQNGSSDYAWVIPPDSSVPFSIGTWMRLRKTGSGEITITKGSGVTFRGVLGDVNVKIDGEDGFYIYIEKTAANIWLLSGNVKSV